MTRTQPIARFKKLFSILAVAAATLCWTAGFSQAQYSQDFDAFADGTTDFGDGSSYDTNNAGGFGVFEGVLVITTDGVDSTRTSFRIPALANSSLGWTATFDFAIIDSEEANDPADGFSFSYGAIPPFTVADTSVNGWGSAEEGFPGVDHISFEVDTWRNGEAEQGVNISVNNTNEAFTNGVILDDGTTVIATATISWDPVDGASFLTTGLVTNADFVDIPTPGFTGSDDMIFAFTARTGGANESFVIDNLVITAIPEPSSLVLAVLGLMGLVNLAWRRRSR